MTPASGKLQDFSLSDGTQLPVVTPASGRLQDFSLSDGTQLPVFLRYSTRAKHQRLSLSFTGHLEIVCPLQKKRQQGEKSSHKQQSQEASSSEQQAEADKFLEQHRNWIERAAKRTRQERESYQSSQAAGLPLKLEFALGNESWRIEYRETRARSVSFRDLGLRSIDGKTENHALLVSGAIGDEALVKRALKRFVYHRAEAILIPYAQAICAEIGAHPKSIGINRRKTAWAICSAQKEIDIAEKTLFLPTQLIRQIVLHEAAHLTELNHSAAFYQLLYTFPGSSAESEKKVKKASIYIPAWFLDGQ